MGNRELEPRLAGTAFPRVVLFDLDGTLLDSAPDMLAAINVLRGERGHAPATLEQLRPHVPKGALAGHRREGPGRGGEAGRREGGIGSGNHDWRAGQSRAWGCSNSTARCSTARRTCWRQSTGCAANVAMRPQRWSNCGRTYRRVRGR